MLKRTTVYLEESEVETLKKISFIQSVSMAELIRRGVQEMCQTFSHEQKDALSILAEIKSDAKRAGLKAKNAMNNTLEIQKDARRERKKSGR